MNFRIINEFLKMQKKLKIQKPGHTVLARLWPMVPALVVWPTSHFGLLP
jgi:hypothetical protein